MRKLSVLMWLVMLRATPAEHFALAPEAKSIVLKLPDDLRAWAAIQGEIMCIFLHFYFFAEYLADFRMKICGFWLLFGVRASARARAGGH